MKMTSFLNKKEELEDRLASSLKEKEDKSGYTKKRDASVGVKKILSTARDFNFKERFGEMPKSIMFFKKSNALMKLIHLDNSTLRTNSKKGGQGYAKKLRHSIYNPDQAAFIIDYYTREGGK